MAKTAVINLPQDIYNTAYHNSVEKLQSLAHQLEDALDSFEEAREGIREIQDDMHYILTRRADQLVASPAESGWSSVESAIEDINTAAEDIYDTIEDADKALKELQKFEDEFKIAKKNRVANTKWGKELIREIRLWKGK